MSTITLINGRYSDAVAADDRGLAYGDGLFETIKIEAGLAEFLAEHLQRLENGCQRLRIRCDVPIIEAEIHQLLSEAGVDSGILKIIISRGQGGRGYRADFTACANRYISLQSSAVDYCRQQARGVLLRLCDTRLSISPALAGIKHLSRLENVLARSEWVDDRVDEGLLLDIDGRLIEGTMSNVFLIHHGRLHTPALHRCGVEGVVRRVLLERILPALALSCEVTDLSMHDVYAAEELFVCNSLIGIWPVTAVGCHQKGVGNVTLKVQHAFELEKTL